MYIIVVIIERKVNILTIKRRLFISNIMMLIIPILLSITVATVLVTAVMTIAGIKDTRALDERNKFVYTAIQVKSLAEEWAQMDFEEIKSDIEYFSESSGNENMSLSIYMDGKQQYIVGVPLEDSFIESILLEDGDHYFSKDNTGIFRIDAGDYTVLFADDYLHNTSNLEYSPYYQYMFNIGIFLLIIVVAIILITNRLLTHIVINSITTPLNTLIYGVQQIRDGNLQYRIMYGGKDEFAAVCDDFNEMAKQLMDMVNSRQKDDENRRELIAGISHDLRTPLTSIKAYIEGLETGVASTPQLQKRYLGIIKSKSQDLEHIVSQLFLFSKLDIGEFPMKMETLDIGDELNKFIKSVSGEYAQKGMEISLIENVQGVLVNVDIVQLRNVLINILENSLKYGSQKQGIMKVACRSGHAGVSITLTDNGPGVPEETLEKIFYMFYRNDKARTNTSKGSGLGLAISAKIIELLGGTIKARNVREGGLSITLTLPVYRD